MDGFDNFSLSVKEPLIFENFRLIAIFFFFWGKFCLGKPFFDFDMNSLFLIYAIHRTNLLLLVKIQRINMSFLYGFQLTQLVKSLIDK